MADAAQLASLADETPEGRSIVVLAKQRFNLRQREMAGLHAVFVPFTAQTRMSGVDLVDHEIRKGAADAIRKYVEATGARFAAEVSAAVDEVARRGSTPLVVAETKAGRARVLGVIELKDIVKGGHQGAVCRTASHGYQDHHDHRRQPVDGSSHCSGSRSRRLPGRKRRRKPSWR